MSMKNQAEYQGPEFWLKDQLEQWLNEGEPSPAVLADYLESVGLPAVGHDYEPHVWLLAALRVSSERPVYEDKLAKALADFLDGQPDSARRGARPNQIIYNMLHLSAGLANPARLYDPLIRLRGLKSFGASENWLGTTHRRSLLLALIANQKGQLLQDVWTAMLRDQPDPYLGGDWRDGFEGLASMEFAINASGQPDLSAVGEALSVVAAKLENEESPGVEFRRYIRRAMAQDPYGPDWRMGLIEQADRWQWPRWAVRFLPDLCFRPEAGISELILWADIHEFLSLYLSEPRKTWCEGEVVLVALGETDCAAVEDACRQCENLRKLDWFPARTEGHLLLSQGARESVSAILKTASNAITSEMVARKTADQQTATTALAELSGSQQGREETSNIFAILIRTVESPSLRM